MTYTLGQPVSFTRHLHRRKDWDSERRGTRNYWSPERWPGDTKDVPPRDGVVVGVRTLANGDSDLLGYEEGYAFKPKEHFTAYLVAYHLRRKPVLVLPEHLRPKGGLW